MKPARPVILAVNGGSSSVRFGVYRMGARPECQLHGVLDRIGVGGSSLRFAGVDGVTHDIPLQAISDHTGAIKAVLDWLSARKVFETLTAVGYRLVHGMGHIDPELVTQELLDDLRRIQWVDPDHLPDEIELIKAVREQVPLLPHVACFDTAFHAHMPRVARMLAIPRRLGEKGVHRYGFHGLSYAYLMLMLARVAGPGAAKGRVILAHLGSGASLAAVKDGQGIDTSMGFTPASGLPMGTRSGDLDPGLGLYLERTAHMTSVQFDAMANHASGLLGISQTSSDVRDLLAREAVDARAADAIALFCYQAKKWVGAYAAALGGLDTLVFAGGIGENCAPVRERICEGLGFLGIRLDAARNATSADVISTAESPVTVRVIRTNEEWMVAHLTAAKVAGRSSKEPGTWVTQ
jgi:acetate kinase